MRECNACRGVSKMKFEGFVRDSSCKPKVSIIYTMSIYLLNKNITYKDNLFFL